MLIKALLISFMIIMSRAHGGGWPKLPWGLDAWLLASPYLLLYPLIGWWVVPSYLGAVLGLRLGHGRGFNYWIPFKIGSDPEKIEYIIPKSLPVPAKKFLIMFLTGLAVTLVGSVSLAAHGHLFLSLILALSGAAKSVAYFLPVTEWAEYARGALLGLGLSVIL